MEYLALVTPQERIISGNSEFVLGLGFAVLIVWSAVWKGVALWKAARNGQKKWFVCLLIFNTLGILEIIYVLIVSKNREKIATRVKI